MCRIAQQVILLLVACSIAEATLRRVPEECPTIQTALDSVANGDTILISLGHVCRIPPCA